MEGEVRYQAMDETLLHAWSPPPPKARKPNHRVAASSRRQSRLGPLPLHDGRSVESLREGSILLALRERINLPKQPIGELVMRHEDRDQRRRSKPRGDP